MTPSQSHLRTVTMPSSEAEALRSQTASPQQTATKTEPSLESNPGIEEAAMWADGVRAAPASQREEMLIVAIAHGKVEQARTSVILGALRRLMTAFDSQLFDLSKTSAEMQTVLGATIAESRDARDESREARAEAGEARAVAGGAIDILTDLAPGSVPAMVASGRGSPSDFTVTQGVGPGGRPASQRAIARQALVDAEVASSRQLAPVPPAAPPPAPPKPAPTRAQKWATRAFEAGALLVAWVVYEISKSFALHYLNKP